MLDHTMIMYGSGMNSGEGGDHSPDNLPLLVAGGHALGLKHGQHIAHNPEQHPPLSNVLGDARSGDGTGSREFPGLDGDAERIDVVVTSIPVGSACRAGFRAMNWTVVRS